MIEEIERRDRLRTLVAQAGYIRDSKHWVLRAEVKRAVAKLTGDDPNSTKLGAELRQFLLAEGWKERMNEGDWQWRARKRVVKAAKKR